MPVQEAITYGVRDDLMVAAMEDQDFIPIAPEVLPIREVTKNNGQLGKWGIGNFTQLVAEQEATRESGAPSRILKTRVGEITFACKETALKAPYDDKDRAEYESQFQMERVQTYALLKTARLLREYQAKTLVFNTTTFSVGNGNYYDPTVAFDNASAKLRDYIKYALNKLYTNGGDPKTAKLAMNYNIFMTMLISESIVQNLRGVVVPSAEVVEANSKMLAMQLGVAGIIVGGASYSTAEENQTPALANIWPNTHVMLANFGTGGNPAEARLGATYVNTSDVGYEQIDVYRENDPPADWFRFRGSSGMQIDFPKRGVLIATNVA